MVKERREGTAEVSGLVNVCPPRVTLISARRLRGGAPGNEKVRQLNPVSVETSWHVAQHTCPCSGTNGHDAHSW